MYFQLLLLKAIFFQPLAILRCVRLLWIMDGVNNDYYKKSNSIIKISSRSDNNSRNNLNAARYRHRFARAARDACSSNPHAPVVISGACGATAAWPDMFVSRRRRYMQQSLTKPCSHFYYTVDRTILTYALPDLDRATGIHFEWQIWTCACSQSVSQSQFSCRQFGMLLGNNHFYLSRAPLRPTVDV